MISSTQNPQSQPPLQFDGFDDGSTHSPTPSSRPLYSLSHPATSDNDDDDVGNSIPSSPTQNNSLVISSVGPGNNISIDSGSLDQSDSLTNFMKYGSIRPPASVLQEEFLEKYRLWKEHAVPLDGIDKVSYRGCGRTGGGKVGGSGGSGSGGGGESPQSGGDVWAGHMASIQTLYARHHRPNPLQENPTHYERLSALFEPRSGLMIGKNEAVYEQKCCEDEEKFASGDEDEDSTDCIASSADFDERKELERLAALLFQPGSKLSGTIEIQHATKSRSNYELVVMERETTDEIGQPKGMLARHKFAGDEQCIFVKLSFVPVPSVETAQEEEKESSDGEGVASDSEGQSSDGENETKKGDNNELQTPSEEKFTIQMEYIDGDHSIQGLWNHETLCFEGTVKKLSESQDDQNQIGGTIVSGLISGHSGYNDGGINDDHQAGSGDGNIISRRSSPSSNLGTRTFLLTPCSHLHPRGISPATLWPSISEALSRMGILTVHHETTPTGESVIRLKEPDAATAPSNENSKSSSDKPIITPEKRKVLLDEVRSHDNLKLVLHRARTETLRRQTLLKLVDLGSVIDFAELARKRNVAKRREKWRKRFRRYNPASLLPRRLPSRHRTTSKTSSVVSKDNVEKKKVQFFDQLASISWGDLLDEASVQAETTCAVFRRQTALLDNLKFESDEYKAQVMSDLRMNGLTLAKSHSQWDQCIQSGRTIALGWSWFERGSWSCFERSAVVGKRCVFLLFQMHSRLEANHKHLEKAYRGADDRLTNTQLEKIRTGFYAKNCAGGAKNESDKLCGICQCDMEEEGENGKDHNPSACLPCSHSFHWECIREWLHDHSQCPICRVDLHES